MRLLAAIGLFLLSLALLFVGVAQRTIWHPPAFHQVRLDYEGTNPFAVLSNATLSAYPGKPVVSVQGGTSAFIASGSENDVRAWLGTTSHTEINLVATKSKVGLQATSVSGTSDFASPLGSDLWRDYSQGQTYSELTVSPSQSGAVLIASNGFLAAPSDVTIRWPITYSLTPSNLFLGFGFGTLVAAFIMNILAIRENRRKRGPRRKTPKAPQGPKLRRQRSQIAAPVRGRRAARKLAVAASGLTLMSMLAGCATNSAAPLVSPTPTPSTTISANRVSLTYDQMLRITSDVSRVASRGDKARNANALASRFIGPALELRNKEYFLQKKSKQVAPLPEIADAPLKFALPAATSSWPRVLMVVTEKSGSNAPQMLVLQQDSARSQYLVHYVIALMSGVTIPNVPIYSVGAIPAAVDSVYLSVPPVQIPATYGDVIDNGSASLSAGLFDVTHDKFFQDMSQNEKQQVAKLTKGKINFRHVLGSKDVLALSTSDGGALVGLYMKDIYTIKPAKPGSAVSVSGNEKLMLGSVGSTTGIRSTYGNMMLFYVPPLQTQKRVRLLGVTQGLLQVGAL